MPDQARPGHPYIPNSVPQVKAEMLAAIGAGAISGILGGEGSRPAPVRPRLHRRHDESSLLVV